MNIKRKLVSNTLNGVFASLILLSGAAYAAVSNMPLFLSVSTDPNVLFNMSVEAPMGGAAYNDGLNSTGCTDRVEYPEGGGPPHNHLNTNLGVCYADNNTYLGYFDPDKCYQYESTDGGYFKPIGPTNNAQHECSNKFSGNFMNWATMTSMDEFVYATTGGNRVKDSPTLTVIQRARKGPEHDYFPLKRVSLNAIPNLPAGSNGVNVNPSTVTPYGNNEVFIYNTKFKVRFGTKPWKTIVPGQRGSLHNGGGGSAAHKGVVLGKFKVRVEVCNTAAGLEANCVLQANGSYKPHGLIQENRDSMRFGVMSYSGADGDKQNGGVLRAEMKYIGATMPDGAGGTIINPLKEIDGATGKLIVNAEPLVAIPGEKKSGVITYLNKFNQNKKYMEIDPAGELFYESTRYFRNLGPTPDYHPGGKHGGFPIITNWKDPVVNECQKHFIIGINDAFPWLDKRVPGTYFTNSGGWGTNEPADFGEPIADIDLDNASGTSTTYWTNRVGALEGINNSVRRVGCVPGDCNHAATDKFITRLGEVMGTAVDANDTEVNRENTYYIAGLAYYLNTQDIRADHVGEQNVSTFMIDSQEYHEGSLPVSGEMNLLWLAGKYGGFNDDNGDDVPQLAEWDADLDGLPDNYVLATEPDKMIAGLRKAFNLVANAGSSVSSLAANSTSVSAGTNVFQANFNTKNWSGTFKAFGLNPANGQVIPGAIWGDTEAGIPNPGARNIFSYSAGSAIDFDFNQMTVSQQGLWGSADIVDYIRGDRSLEGPLPSDLRVRDKLLGAVISSSPAYVGRDEDYGYSDIASYAGFVAAKSGRTPMVYVASNEGMLHGFRASNGDEMMAYLPESAFDRTIRTTEYNYGCEASSCLDFQFVHDGSPSVGDYYDGAWHTGLVNSLGAGGSGVYAIDVTNSVFAKGKMLWEYSKTSAGFSHLGNYIPKSSIARLNGAWVAVVSNGLDNTTNKAVLYLIDIVTGAQLAELNTNAGSAGAPNGLAEATVVDTDADNIGDTIYAGDKLGNMWEFDVSGAVGSWTIANGGAPLFTALDTAGVPQPITSAPAYGAHPNGGGMVYFGTGKFIEVGDNVVSAATQVNSFYAIHDDAGTGPITGRGQLLEQTILDEVSLTVPLMDFRLTSRTVMPTPATRGWFIDLLSPVNGVEGERMVYTPQLRSNRIVFVTITPVTDPCAAGGSSWFMELDPLTGGRLSDDIFGGDGVFDDSDYTRLFDADGDGIMDPYNSVGGRRIDHLVPNGTILRGGTRNGIDIEYTVFPGPNADGTGALTFESAVPKVLVPAGVRSTWRQLQ